MLESHRDRFAWLIVAVAAVLGTASVVSAQPTLAPPSLHAVGSLRGCDNWEEWLYLDEEASSGPVTAFASMPCELVSVSTNYGWAELVTMSRGQGERHGLANAGAWWQDIITIAPPADRMDLLGAPGRFDYRLTIQAAPVAMPHSGFEIYAGVYALDFYSQWDGLQWLDEHEAMPLDQIGHFDFIFGEPLEFQVFMEANADVYSYTSDSQAVAWVAMRTLIQWEGIVMIRAGDETIIGSGLTSASGTDWMQAQHLPEPCSMCLLAIGAAALLGRTRFARIH